MNKTETPELSAAVLGRLRDYATLFRDDFCRHDQARWTALYLQGLLRDGERKSIEPLARRVVLPAEWDIQDPAQALQNFVNQSPWQEKLLWQRYRRQLALALLDQVRSEGLPGNVVVTDAGYGTATDFRQGLHDRGLFYLAGVTGETGVFAEAPRWQRPPPTGNGRPPSRCRLATDSPPPLSVQELGTRVPLRRKTWREGTKGKLSGRFAWLRVWPAHGWQQGQCAVAEPVWLLIEEQADGQIKYALSNLP